MKSTMDALKTAKALGVETVGINAEDASRTKLGRLIEFAVEIIRIAQTLPHSDIGKHIRNQLVRSGTSPAANYGEAKSAESRQDFIHKLKLALKELRETNVWLLVIKKADLVIQKTELMKILEENEELISILFKSTDTAKSNLRKIKDKKP